MYRDISVNQYIKIIRCTEIYSVSQKRRLPFVHVQISALIQTTYCCSLKFILAFQRRIRKNVHTVLWEMN